jgi:hypothetical protein
VPRSCRSGSRETARSSRRPRIRRKAVDVLAELAEIAKAVEVEVEKAKREAESAGP